MTEAQRKAIIAENDKRKKVMFAPYNPVTGEGSPIERVPLNFTTEGLEYNWNIPLRMYEEEIQFLDLLLKHKSVETLLEIMGHKPSQRAINGFVKELIEIRFRYDFEYWAIMTVKIKDKESEKMIPFRLNRPQRRLLARLEKMRLAGVPIRIILLKARQWGGSTLVQVYMAWIQTIHKTNWHSVVVTDVEEQARNIRGMYSRLAKSYPKAFGTINMVPFEGSNKTKMIEGRGSTIGIGSVQKPEGLRSFDLAMCHLCLAPGTLIPIEDGFLKKIEDLVVGDKVITHNGADAKISNITKSIPTEFNGNGRSIIITPWLGHAVTLTPNHPVLTQRGWVNAGDLRINEYVSMPIRPITNEIKSVQLSSFPQSYRGGGKKPKGNGMIIPLNQETGFAFGYYLAEGSVHISPQRIGFISTMLIHHDNENEYGQRAMDALLPFASSHTRKKRKGVLTTVEILYRAVLAEWINRELGAKENKRIPDWFFKCGKEFIIGVFEGYLSGDGTKSNGKQGNIPLAVMSVTTVSSSLAMQVRDIAASLGLGWAAIDKREAGNYYGRNCKKTFIVRWAGVSARNIKKLIRQEYPNNGWRYAERNFLTETHAWTRIRKIEESSVDIVYDIEVDHPDHSFRTMYFSVKNSEVAFYKSTAQRSAEDLVQNIRAGIGSMPYTLSVMESTAKGVGNFFHREWLAAVSGKSSYDPVFVPWFEIERYMEGIDDIESFINWMMRKENDYALALWNKGATLEGIKWYFNYKAGENFDDWRMKSEFPSDALEAFQSTGARVFHQSYVNRARENCTDPIFKGDIQGRSMKGKDAFEGLEFQQNDKGTLWIWNFPDKTMEISDRYVTIVDIGGRTDDADWSVIKVFDRYWQTEGGVPETVAVWEGHIDQDLVSWKAAQIARIYNNAMLIVEFNSLKRDQIDSEGTHHLTVLNEIVKFYKNIFARNDPEKIRQGLPAKYGFHTNASTKPMVIDELNGALRDETYIERDARACDQMDTYEVKPDGSYGAVDNCHDDHVIVTAIGVWACLKYLPLPKEIVKGRRQMSKVIVSEASI